MAKTPNIRFKGFTEEWKEAPLSRYLMVSNERNDDNRYTAQDIQSVSGEYGVVNQIEFQGRSFAGASLLNYRVIHHGEIAYTKSPLKLSPYGIIKANKNVTGIVSALYGVYKVKQGDANFIQCYFDLRSRLNNYLRPLVNKGAKNTLLITDEDAIAGKVVFPKDLEQKEITSFIDNISSTILQRETELEKLKNIKRALLEKLFPQNGQTVPAIRFKGHTEEWEGALLGKEIKEAGTKNRDNLPLDSYSITNEAGFIPQTEQFENGGYMANADKTLYTIVPPHSFAYNPARINVGSIGYYNGDNDIIVSSLYIVFQTSIRICDDFLMAWFKSNIFNHLIYTLQEGGVRQYFFYDKIVQCPIMLPKKSEQEKIAKLVNSLNKNISLRERQLTLLKHTKQALLEQMFVNE